MYTKHYSERLEQAIRLVDKMFYRENAIRQAIQEAREEEKGGKSGGQGNGHAFVSDPTAIQGIKAATELRSVTLWDGSTVVKPERWLKIIDATYAAVDELTKEVVRMKYRRERYTSICRVMNVSESKMYDTVQKFRQAALLQAVQAGLVRVCE